MNDLKRGLAPITEEAWKEIEDEAKRALAAHMGARKLVDFKGPRGWEASSVPTGRVDKLESPVKGLDIHARRVQPLIELNSPFRLSRSELDAVERGAADPDLGPVTDAARRLARAENRILFYGYDPAGIPGIRSGSEQQAVQAERGYDTYPDALTTAMEQLRERSVGGPYAAALGPEAYTGLARTSGPGGYPVLLHVRRLLDGPVVWVPALEGGVVMSLRGGDFEMVVGRDVAIGYRNHSSDEVELYLEESMTFRILAPEAAVPITFKS